MVKKFSRSQQVDIMQKILHEANKEYQKTIQENESETANEDLEKSLKIFN